MTDETNIAAGGPVEDSAAATDTATPQSDGQRAAWLKYQAKIEVVREVLARRGAINEQEAKLLSDCVNTAFDAISFK